MEQQKPNMEEFLARVEKMKKEGGVDLSVSEDLSIAVMNLISLEEHFFFTAAKTGDEKYFDSSGEIREMRKQLLKELMPSHEGETWCIAKHLLSAAMRLIEVGNKLQSENRKEDAKAKFLAAYKIYSIFWALKLSLLKGNKVQEAAKESGNFESLLSKLADCCNE